MRERCADVLRGLREAVPFHMATVWTHADGQLVPAAAVGRPLDLLESVPFEQGMGLRSWVYRTGRTVRIPSRGRGFRDSALRGFLAVPVECGPRRLGVLAVARTDGEFTDEDVRRVQEAAGWLAQALVEEGPGG
ncbi:MAG: GAF domain-containing protein [Armatimonadota bacterium]|nr:GAF domain-containing protein [Armatimonadota bacterium]MDW8155934.1 GAF domain-containing protein [Armatimonadota bacterium]